MANSSPITGCSPQSNEQFAIHEDNSCKLMKILKKIGKVILEVILWIGGIALALIALLSIPCLKFAAATGSTTALAIAGVGLAVLFVGGCIFFGFLLVDKSAARETYEFLSAADEYTRSRSRGCCHQKPSLGNLFSGVIHAGQYAQTVHA
ncbi:hypothetical protein C10C_0333 [Chlamydia serpentis]|uniref:Uncharacterized protein n=1 Tax=Chlamydia serpentis TaxID=1967782 RepID=A0A2R8FAR5_9CHLA|nr:hypothetical protein [Chlamydia serpentis]SPN73505.1 hypothetical protein C10C_0333 [Chlamydia serpentis]